MFELSNAARRQDAVWLVMPRASSGSVTTNQTELAVCAQVAEKQAELERTQAALQAERAAVRAERACAATLRQRLDGAVSATALLEAKAASAKREAAKDAEALQVGD
jgi:hypothetical protein